jgi:hypothetical protein
MSAIALQPHALSEEEEPEETPSEETPSEETPSEEASPEIASPEGAASEEVSPEDTSPEDASPEEVSLKSSTRTPVTGEEVELSKTTPVTDNGSGPSIGVGDWEAPEGRVLRTTATNRSVIDVRMSAIDPRVRGRSGELKGSPENGSRW